MDGKCIRFPIDTARHFFYPETETNTIGEMVTAGEVYNGWKKGQHWYLGGADFAATSFRAGGYLAIDPQASPLPTFSATQGHSYAVKPFLPTSDTSFTGPTHSLYARHQGSSTWVNCGYFKFETSKLTTYAKASCLSTTSNCGSSHVAGSFCKKDELYFQKLASGTNVSLPTLGGSDYWTRCLELQLAP